MINMRPSSCKREVVPSPSPEVKKFKNKTQKALAPSFLSLPSRALQTSSPKDGTSQAALPQTALPIPAPGSCPRALPRLAECEE